MPADRLTESERVSLGTLPQAVSCQRVRLYRSTAPGGAGLIRRIVLFASGNRAVTLGNHVFLPERHERDLALLAHELTHCGQYQKWGALRYFTAGFRTQMRDFVHRWTGAGSSPYQYVIEPGKPFDSYGMEQQGQIVEDSFRGDPAALSISPHRPDGRSGNYTAPSA
jgi:hypothetical protein